MKAETVVGESGAVGKYLKALDSQDLLIKLSWGEWLDITAPYPKVGFTKKEVTTRFYRNGYDWDIHGSIYTPEKEVDKGLAFVLFHGGAGSEKELEETPDGRPGLGTVLASRGFNVLAVSYPGHYPPGGIWTKSVAERNPIYLFGKELSDGEITDRNLKCTFNVILQGAGRLVDVHLAGHRILAFGHSTGGPMAAHLYRFSREAKVIGLVGWGSGGPDGWRLNWREETNAEPGMVVPVDQLSRRSPKSFEEAAYVDPKDLCPWGEAEGYMKWGDKYKSQMKTSLCDNQHMVNVAILEEYPRRSGLSREEYFDHLRDPDPEWLKSISVLLVVGDNDKGHWIQGDEIEDKREMYMARKYSEHTRRTHVVLIPRYGHFGYVELHNEKIAYLWLWAHKNDFFK